MCNTCGCRIGLIIQIAVASLLVAPPALAAAQQPPDATATQPASQPAPVEYSCDTADALDGWALEATGEAAKRMPKPKLLDGKLYLLESWWKSTAAVAPPMSGDHLPASVEIAFTLIMNTGTEGMGFAWLDVQQYGVAPTIPPPLAAEDRPGPGGNANIIEDDWGWEAPSLLHAFGVGFDASDPPNRDPFRGSGNVYDRPQHEISLHWNGLEVAKQMTTTEFRDEQPHAVQIRIVFVTGGAEISLRLDDEAVYEHYFIPSMTAYIGRPVFGARNKETAGDVLLDNLSIRCAGQATPAEPPLRIVALDRALNDKSQRQNTAIVDFPDGNLRFGRIICTLRLDQPETRFDPWDRIAQILISAPPRKTSDDARANPPERFELLRYITPYHRGHVWQVDVSDFRPLLTGRRQIVQACTTYGEGWLVSVTFDFYPGPHPDGQYAARVVNLWNGDPEIGNPDKPVSAFYVPQKIDLPDDVVAAKLRMVVTGHGMSPNSGNAAEFLKIGRTLTINGATYRNELWKTDNYLNPCRPQGGTWKYDRAGWAPGDVVQPWEVLLAPLPQPASSLEINYALDDYVNENRGQASPPTHTTQSQLILYRASER